MLFRSGFKTPSQAQWLRCSTHCNAHPPECVADSTSNARNALPLNLMRGFETTSRISLNISYLQVYFYREKKR
jgi:hypothetical protein